MPVVYVVDIEKVDAARRFKSGSGLLVHSDEWTVRDLSEDEFNVLFFDPDTDVAASDPDLRTLGAGIEGTDALAAADALEVLLARCT
jgi:hypothetical protein